MRWCLRVILFSVVFPSETVAFECTRSSRYDFVSLRWDTSAPIEYGIQKNPDQRLDQEYLVRALEAGFSAWSEPSCSSLQFVFKGEVERQTALSVINQIAIISEDWPVGTVDAVGLTTMSYNPLNGVISYGKIEINESEFEFVDVLEPGAICGVNYDLHAVLTHEIGHFLGFAHVSEEYAAQRRAIGEDEPTMSPEILECDGQFRTLEADDLEAICYMYPSGQSSRSCATLPSQDTPFISSEAFGCSLTLATIDSSNWRDFLGLIVLGLAFLIFRLGIHRFRPTAAGKHSIACP